MNLAFLPTPEEFARAHATPRAYVVVDLQGLRWVPRPVYAPPRLDSPSVNALRRLAGRVLSLKARIEALPRLSAEPPTVRRASSLVVAERVIADEALLDCAAAHATERAAREKAEASLQKMEQACSVAETEYDRAQRAKEQTERERDTALARVKEWERAYDSNGFGPQNPSEVQVFLRERDRVNGQVAALRVSAAESALASARELIERARAWLAWPTPAEPGPEPAACLLNALESWLSSAPSPAPCSGCAAAADILRAAYDRSDVRLNSDWMNDFLAWTTKYVSRRGARK